MLQNSQQSALHASLLLLFKANHAMPSETIDLRCCNASAASSPGAFPNLAAQRPKLAHARKRTLGTRLRTTLLAVSVSLALSGCGVFCGAAGGSGGGFAGGCGTGMRL